MFLWKENKIDSLCSGKKIKPQPLCLVLMKNVFIKVNMSVFLRSVSVHGSNKCNVKLHLIIMHIDYIIKYPNNSGICRSKMMDLKSDLSSGQAIFSVYALNKVKAVNRCFV
jgi:hypothetical protein